MDFETVFELLQNLVPELRQAGPDFVDRVRNNAHDFFKMVLLDLRSQLPARIAMREEAREALAELENHLQEVEHSPSSPCWEDRAHLLQVLAYLQEQNERLLAVVTAIYAFLEDQAGVRVVN